MSKRYKRLVRKGIAAGVIAAMALTSVMYCVANEGVLWDLGCAMSVVVLLACMNVMQRVCETKERHDKARKEEDVCLR